MTTSPTLSNSQIRRNELLSGIAESSAQHLIQKHGLAPEIAGDIGNSLADHLVEQWKGQHIYLPSEQAYKFSERDLEINRRMERGNAQDLAKEFGMSYTRVYQICRRVRAAMQKERAASPIN